MTKYKEWKQKTKKNYSSRTELIDQRTLHIPDYIAFSVEPIRHYMGKRGKVTTVAVTCKRESRNCIQKASIICDSMRKVPLKQCMT